MKLTISLRLWLGFFLLAILIMATVGSAALNRLHEYYCTTTEEGMDIWTISSPGTASPTFIDHLLGVGARTRTVSISGTDPFNNWRLQIEKLDALADLQELRVFSLEDSSDIIYPTKCLAKLQKIVLFDCEPVWVRYFLRRCPKSLRELEFQDLETVRDSDVARISELTQIESLAFNNVKVTSAIFAYLGNCQRLESLEFYMCDRLQNADLRELSKPKALRRLRLHSAQGGTIDLRELQGLKQLADISIEGFTIDASHEAELRNTIKANIDTSACVVTENSGS